MTCGETTGMESQPRLASGRAVKQNQRASLLEVLHRKFVSGPMTLEQYEAELDKLGRLE